MSGSTLRWALSRTAPVRGAISGRCKADPSDAEAGYEPVPLDTGSPGPTPVVFRRGWPTSRVDPSKPTKAESGLKRWTTENAPRLRLLKKGGRSPDRRLHRPRAASDAGDEVRGSMGSSRSAAGNESAGQSPQAPVPPARPLLGIPAGTELRNCRHARDCPCGQVRSDCLRSLAPLG